MAHEQCVRGCCCCSGRVPCFNHSHALSPLLAHTRYTFHIPLVSSVLPWAWSWLQTLLSYGIVRQLCWVPCWLWGMAATFHLLVLLLPPGTNPLALYVFTLRTLHRLLRLGWDAISLLLRSCLSVYDAVLKACAAVMLKGHTRVGDIVLTIVTFAWVLLPLALPWWLQANSLYVPAGIAVPFLVLRGRSIIRVAWANSR